MVPGKRRRAPARMVWALGSVLVLLSASTTAHGGGIRLADAESYAEEHPEDRVGLRDLYLQLLDGEEQGSPAREAAARSVREIESELPEAYVVLAGDRGRPDLDREHELRYAHQLASGLRSPHRLVRLRAAEYLAKLRSGEAARKLVEALKREGDPEVLAAVKATLASIRDARVSKLLSTLYREKDEGLQRQALEVLGKLAKPRDETIRDVSTAIGCFLFSRAELVPQAAFDLLRELGRDGAWGLMNAVSVPDPALKLRVIRALGDTGEGSAAGFLAPFMVFGVKGQLDEYKKAAAAAIEKIGRPCIPWLARFIDCPRHRQWTKYVVFLITGLGFESREALLAWWSRQPEAKSAEAAARAHTPRPERSRLELRPLPESAEELLSYAAEYAREHPEDRVGLRDLYRLIVEREGSGPSARGVAEERLREIEEDLREPYRRLARPAWASDISDATVRRLAKDLARDLRSESPLVRMRAAEYLGRLGSEEGAEPLVSALAREQEPIACDALLQALMEVGGAGTPSLLARKLPHRATARAQRGALDLLARRIRETTGEECRAASSAVGAFALCPFEDVADQAVAILEWSGTAGAAGLERALATMNPERRLRVIGLLGEAGIGLSARCLGPFLLHGARGMPNRYREAAIEALVRIGTPAVPHLAPFLSRRRTRPDAYRVLREITGVDFKSEAAAVAWWSRESGVSGSEEPPSPACESVHWVGSLEEALRQARERGAMVFVAMVIDGEDSNEWQKEQYRDPAFVEVSREFVCVYASPGAEHGSKRVEVGGRTVSRCREAPGLVCSEHQACWRDVLTGYSHLNTDRSGAVKIPFHLVLDPDGKVVATIADGTPESGFEPVPAEDLIARLVALTKKHGRGISPEELAQLRATLETAKSLIEGEEYREALERLAEIAESHPRTAMADRARKLSREIVEGGREEIRTALESAREDPAGAVIELLAIRDRYAGTVVQEVARSRLRELQRRPEVRAALEDLELRRKARRLLDRAERALGNGDPAKALTVLECLLEECGSTPEAGRARALASEIRREGDGRK